jgi:hypothetical protein
MRICTLWFWRMRCYPAIGQSNVVILTLVFGVLCGGRMLGETAQHAYINRAGADRRRSCDRQPAAAENGLTQRTPCATS